MTLVLFIIFYFSLFSYLLILSQPAEVKEELNSMQNGFIITLCIVALILLIMIFI